VIGRGPGDVVAEARIPTTTPQATLSETVEFFRTESARAGTLAAIGVGCFGPVDLHEDSPTWGYITTTPKPGWERTDVAGRLRRDLGVPVAFDTDVNAAALGEARWVRPAASTASSTSPSAPVSAGAASSRPAHARPRSSRDGPHAAPRDRAADPFPGMCPFHGDCLEGLASGPALLARWGQPAEGLHEDHPAWPLEAHYLALAVVNFVCTLSPQRIILGGGVMDQRHLFPLIRREVVALLNGYLRASEILDGIDAYIVPPGLGNRSGRLGAIAMAEQLVRA